MCIKKWLFVVQGLMKRWQKGDYTHYCSGTRIIVLVSTGLLTVETRAIKSYYEVCSYVIEIYLPFCPINGFGKTLCHAYTYLLSLHY